jgi:hypothetical protein
VKKTILVVLISILVFGVILIFNWPKASDKPSTIKGAYKSDIDPFITMSFDESNKCKFYFYYIDDNGNQKLDGGEYYHKDNNVFVINSGKFINREIDYDYKNNSFTIIIDGVKHTFKKISNSPIIISTP